MRIPSRPRRWLQLTASAGLVAVMTAACSSSSSPSTTTAPRASSTTYPAFVKVGNDGSVTSKMICGTEGQAVVAAALNETTTKVTKPTWINHVYACDYVYKTGTMSMTVKELSTKAETDAYYGSLKTKYKVKQTFDLGQGAFVAPNGVVVTRKDYKVLTVDPTKLPKQFGQPPTTQANIAIGAASALMSCWTGA